MVAVAACGAAHSSSTGGAGQRSHRPEPIGRLSAPLSLSGSTGEIAGARGSVWVQVFGPPRDSIVRIDPTTNRVLARIPVHESNLLAGSTGGLFVDDSMRWLNPKNDL